MLGGGYDWKAGGFTFGPLTTLQYTYVNLSALTENGAQSLNLRVDQHDLHSLRSTLGARAAYRWELGESVAIIPEARVAWQHEFLQKSETFGSSLDGGNGPSLTTSTTAPARDALYAGAGVNLQLGPQWSANLYYNVDIGSGDFKSQMVSGGVTLKF